MTYYVYLFEDVLGILSSPINIKVFEKYVILSSSVSFASYFNFEIHEFLNSSHFALLQFHRGISSSSSGPLKWLESGHFHMCPCGLSNYNLKILIHHAMHLLPTLARLRITLLINGWGFVRTDIYLLMSSLLPSKFLYLGVNMYKIYYYIKVDYFYW